MAAKPKPIKICLTNQGADQETPWAHELGAAPGPKGSRKVRLVNVPFLHAKPTWGDVIVVSPVEDGLPTWDRNGVAFAKIGTRIVEDGGRWAMIVDYQPRGDADMFDDLAVACAELDVVCEGAWEPKDGQPGRVYLAVTGELSDDDVMKELRAAKLPCELIQIHPQPAKGAVKPVAKPAVKRAAKAPATGKKTVVKKKAAAKKARR